MDSKARLLLATSNCVAICEPAGDDWRVVRRDLMGNYATSVIAQEGQALVGTREGIFRSEDGGDSWRAVNNGLTIRHIRWMAADPDHPGRIFSGSEPAGDGICLIPLKRAAFVDLPFRVHGSTQPSKWEGFYLLTIMEIHGN